LRKLQAHKLLVQQEQEASNQKNRAQKILQVVPEANQAQRDQEVSLFLF